MLRDEICHLVIGQLCEFSGDIRVADLLERRHGEHENLHVVVDQVQSPPTGVEVGQGRVEPEDALPVVAQLRARKRPLELGFEPVEIRPGQDVSEHIDLARH